MQYYQIEFIINSDGSITEKVIASGSNCTAVTQELETAMGKIQSQELLPEYQHNEFFSQSDEMQNLQQE